MTKAELRLRVQERLGENTSGHQRFTNAFVDEVLNDGLAMMATRSAAKVVQASIEAIPAIGLYSMPTDYVRMLRVKRISTFDMLDPLGRDRFWGEYPRYRNQTGDRWRHYTPIGLKQMVFGPRIASPGGTGHVVVSVTGTKDGVNKDFTITDTTNIAVYFSGARMSRTSSPAPATDQYTIIGSATLRLGLAPASDDTIDVDAYPAGFVVDEVPTGALDGANKTFIVSTQPDATQEVSVFHNGFRLDNVASSPGLTEVSRTSKTLTLGYAPESGDTLVVDYTTSITRRIVLVPGSGITRTLVDAPVGGIAVWQRGVRLSAVASPSVAGEFKIAGSVITLGVSDEAPVFASYSTTGGDPDLYELTYVADLGVTSMVLDADVPAIPMRFHPSLVDYGIGRCLLLADSEPATIEKAVGFLARHATAVASLRAETRSTVR